MKEPELHDIVSDYMPKIVDRIRRGPDGVGAILIVIDDGKLSFATSMPESVTIEVLAELLKMASDADSEHLIESWKVRQGKHDA